MKMSTANDLTLMTAHELVDVLNGLARRQAYCLDQAEVATTPSLRRYWQDARRAAQLDGEAVDAELAKRSPFKARRA